MNPAYLPSTAKPARADLRRRIVEAKKANPEMTQAQLATRFGVHQSVVARALKPTR